MIYNVYGIEQETGLQFEQNCYSPEESATLVEELTQSGYIDIGTEERYENLDEMYNDINCRQDS
jgi:ribosome maturation protein Sdo1